MKFIKITYLAFLSIFCVGLSQNLQELQKLQEEYKEVLDKQSLQKPDDVSNAESRARNISLPNKIIYSRKDIESLLQSTQDLLTKLEYYEDSLITMPFIGYDIFTQRDSIPFWQNLPLPKKYLLGPGDEIIISLWGESNSYSNEIINRDGQIFIENIGILNLGGKTLEESKKYLLSKFSNEYSTLLGDKPKSFIDLTLGELKSVNVHFVGLVNIPGIHIVHPFSGVISGLIQAGGVHQDGSLRVINVIRNDKIINRIDLYKYLFGGKKLDDLRLLDQDVIYVPPRKSTIPISGGILRQGHYELLEDENLYDLIKYAGGKKRNSANQVFVYKNNLINTDGYIVSKDDYKNFNLSEGDSISIPSIPKFENFVRIEGHIKNPGKYPYNKNLSLNNLIIATMSLKDENFFRTMDLDNIRVFRKNGFGQDPLEIIVNIKDDLILENGDHITIPRKEFFEKIESIIITGEVKIPGLYPANSSTSLSEVLSLSGGYTDEALEGGIEIFRDSVKIAWENSKFYLSGGDSLNVVRRTGLIEVVGEVNVPGFINFEKNISIKKYIKKAGGLTSFADKNNIYIIYPNGTSAPNSKWFAPKVNEGSKIIVNPRTISGPEDQNGFENFSVIAGQAASIATTLLSLSLIANRN